MSAPPSLQELEYMSTLEKGRARCAIRAGEYAAADKARREAQRLDELIARRLRAPKVPAR